jgi:hypothetical protein
MTDEERRAILGDDIVAHIREAVDAAPEPTSELVDDLRRFFAPAGRASCPRPAAEAA